MDIKKYAVESDKIFLADESPEFAKLEGEVPEDERVWVKVRQATQADNIRLADINTQRERKYSGDQLTGNVNSVSLVYNSNPLRRQATQVYLTVVEIGNLTDGDKPVFDVAPLKKMPEATFLAKWGSLRTELANAIHKACLKVNPDWDDLLLGE